MTEVVGGDKTGIYLKRFTVNSLVTQFLTVNSRNNNYITFI